MHQGGKYFLQSSVDLREWNKSIMYLWSKKKNMFDICETRCNIAIVTRISRASVEKGWLVGTRRVSLFETISVSREGSPLKLFTWRGTAWRSSGPAWLHIHYREGCSPSIVGRDYTVHSNASECNSSAFYDYFVQFNEMNCGFILDIKILKHN